MDEHTARMSQQKSNRVNPQIGQGDGMNFSTAAAYLLSLGNEVETMKLGLMNVRILLDALGNPHNNYLKVQVAGTNGKGSVCAFLDQICVEAGIQTGLYTSPHLISITERIKIGGQEISKEDFARLATLVRETSESLVAEGRLETVPTYFEQVTAMALTAFSDARVELAILETGLGGRFDATTAANAEIAAITRIDLDHQEYLGETIEEVATEKAAIIHAGSKVVIGSQQPRAMKVLMDRCSMAGVFPLTFCEPNLSAFDTSKHSNVVAFRTNRFDYWDSSLGLAGKHQIENACTAVMVAETLRVDFSLSIDEEAVWNGLEDARHPGRLEYQGRFLLDGAHNVGGTKALAEFIQEYETRQLTLVFGAMNDKNVSEILAILAPLAKRIIVAEPSNSRSLTCAEILEQLPPNLSKVKTFATDNVANALDIAREVTPADEIILVTGSLYLVGEAKKILNN